VGGQFWHPTSRLDEKRLEISEKNDIIKKEE
jgi:hypothetical protein